MSGKICFFRRGQGKHIGFREIGQGRFVLLKQNSGEFFSESPYKPWSDQGCSTKCLTKGAQNNFRDHVLLESCKIALFVSHLEQSRKS